MMQQGNSLLNDFFGSSPLRAQGRQVRTGSEPATVEILPRPDGLAGNWLPAEEIRLHDSWTENPPQLRAGEPVTRTITVEARGLTGSQIPVLEPGEPADTRLYPEQPVIDSRTDGNKVFGFSRQSFTYIPDRTGKLRVPPIELAWWNIDKDQEELAQLPEWELNVARGSGAAARPPAQSAPSGKPDNAPSAGSTSESRTPLSESPGTTLLERYWWILVLLLIVPLLYLLARKTATGLQDSHRTPRAGLPAKPVNRCRLCPAVGSRSNLARRSAAHTGRTRRKIRERSRRAGHAAGSRTVCRSGFGMERRGFAACCPGCMGQRQAGKGCRG
jgi:hypothetical protein